MSFGKSPPLQRVSLLASSFTGSTLLGIMLSQDKRFLGMGDTYLIPTVTDENHTCSCGRTVTNCEFRVKLGEKLKQRDLPVDMILDMKYRLPGTFVSSRFGGLKISSVYRVTGKVLGYERAYGQFLRREAKFLECIKTLGDYEYYLDGSKSLVRADIFTNSNQGGQIIHLLRDPFAVLHSGATRHSDRRRGVRAHLQGWMQYNRKARGLCDRHPDTSVSIAFDNLVGNPSSILDSLSAKFGWGELDVQPDNLDPKNTHIIGNGSRHSSSKVRAKQLKPGAEELLELGVPQSELDEVSSAYEQLRSRCEL